MALEAMGQPDSIAIHRSSVETLTVEAMVLLDELESYSASSDDAIKALTPEAYAIFTHIRLQSVAKLTKMVDWLVRLDANVGGQPEQAWARVLDPNLDGLPPRARALIAAAQVLFLQVDRLSNVRLGLAPVESPARILQERLSQIFERDG